MVASRQVRRQPKVALASNSPSAVDQSQFEQVVFKGIEGFALFEIEQTAREWDEYNEANSQFGVGA
jgi:hypothetical protein